MSTDTKRNAVDVLTEYCRLQAKLVTATLAAYPHMAKDKLLTFLDRTGTVQVDGETWRFVKHGFGVRYLGVTTGRWVDPHVAVIDHPEALDACRLERYWESISVFEVWFDGEPYDVTEEEKIRPLLEVMAARGKLGRVLGLYPLYVLKQSEHVAAQ